MRNKYRSHRVKLIDSERFEEMKKRTLILTGALVPFLLCLGCFVLAGKKSSMGVPPILQAPPHGLDAAKSRGPIVYLQAWPTLPGRGVQVSVINDSNQDYELDLRPLCELSGLEAFAVDTEGKEHELDVFHFLPTHPYSFPGSVEKALISGFERVVLHPHESFSWPVSIGHPEDRMMLEFRPLPYKIDHFQCVLSLEKGVKLRSNTFELGTRPTLTRRQGQAPKKKFSERLDSFRWWHRKDPGARLATLLGFCGMKRQGMLSDEQFSQVLAASMEDAYPLIRAHAAAFPPTWQTLLLDANRRVRHEALNGAGGSLAHQQMNLMPILLGKIQDGDSPTKILALKALAKHTGGRIGRQFQETIAQAKNDSESKVADTARQLFDWVKNSQADKANAQPHQRPRVEVVEQSAATDDASRRR
jgi:hypothetical protein